MAPRPSSGELWGHNLMPTQVEMTFFLPNGMVVLIKVNREATLEQIKTELWKVAKGYPLFYCLQPPDFYIFVGVTQDAEKEEFYDEKRRLCNLRLFQPLLKLVKPVGNKQEKELNAKLTFTIGMTITDFDESKDPEVFLFRQNILNFCKSINEEKESKGRDTQAMYVYPPNVHPVKKLSTNLTDIIKKDHCMVIISVWYLSTNKDRCKYTVKVRYDAGPKQVIEETIRRKIKSDNVPLECHEEIINKYSSLYCLKVCGFEEFLLGDYPICNYKYIRQKLSSGQIADLMLLNKDDVNSVLEKFLNCSNIPKTIPRGLSVLKEISSQSTISIWQFTNKKFKIKINNVTFINFREKGKCFVRAGLYHGTEPLCKNLETKHILSSDSKWNQWLEFDIFLANIPRCAKLCLSFCYSLNKKNKKILYFAQYYNNINLYDHNGKFISENTSLKMWSMPPGYDDFLYPLGISGFHPCSQTPILDIEFHKYGKNKSLVYPSHQEIIKYAESIQAQSPPLSKEQIDRILYLINKDILTELTEQDKELLWSSRIFCKTNINSLPKLLQALKWNSKDDVANVYLMLEDWPIVNNEVALQLLYSNNVDPIVRNYAVKCFEQRLSNSQLLQYLMQLVQVLGCEPYLDNNLVRFLLKRSLMNQRIGQSFFWFLRSGMQHNIRHLYFGLILEAFLRSCGKYFKLLMQQVEVNEKLLKLSDELKTEKEDQQLKSLQNLLQTSDYLEVLQNFPSPLNHSVIVGKLNIERCDIKLSKKRPILLTWENPDQMADVSFSHYQIIFKTGDDLRQDMLTLQIIDIMDSIWQTEGLDLKMLPYNCLATGLNVGMIEIVKNAKTVMQIMNKEFRSRELHNWIKEKNKPIHVSLDSFEKCPYHQAIDSFTKSCAGYCVATFVLGIGDRHPSNIMVTETGQVFHIDFGHFLNHRKKKFGVNRERVPFVLTEDFIKVIAKGKDNPIKSEEFNEFMQLCGKAYLCLRNNANLLITLFMMMLNSSIPELQSFEDVDYIRHTLKLNCDKDSEALEYFQEQFNEAYGGAWTTKIDWFFHWVKHNN